MRLNDILKYAGTALILGSFIFLLFLSYNILFGEKYHRLDYFELFNDTPVEELAKAVRSNDIKKIRKLVVDDGLDINYQEEKYGHTVLMAAISSINESIHHINANTIQTLLELDADPNIFAHNNAATIHPYWETKNGMNPVLEASDGSFAEGLGLLLKYGGDPKSMSLNIDEPGSKVATALILAAKSQYRDDDLATLKLLIDAGADVNQITESYRYGALPVANGMRRMLFLLEHGADPNVRFSHSELKDSTISITEYLRRQKFRLNDVDYKYKRKIIEILKQKGIDYESTPIPDDILERIKIEYPNNWEKYAAIY